MSTSRGPNARLGVDVQRSVPAAFGSSTRLVTTVRDTDWRINVRERDARQAEDAGPPWFDVPDGNDRSHEAES